MNRPYKRTPRVKITEVEMQYFSETPEPSSYWSDLYGATMDKA